MSIKNYFVRAEKLREGIKGIKYAKYLVSQNHPNHKNTQIVEIYNTSTQWMNLAASNAARVNAKKSLNGGRPTKRFGHSFVFSIPSGSPAPSDKQWKEVTGALITTLAHKLKIDKKILLKHCYVVAHNQKNPHIHIVVGGVINNTTYNQQLSSERTVYALKNEFNHSCYKTLKLNHLEHIPETSGNKRISKIKLEQKLLLKSQGYFKKWVEYTLEENSAQSKRQFNRLVKSLNSLDESNHDTAEEFINTIEHKIPNIRKKLGNPNYE
jgi:hypothetical protein